MAKIVMKFGGTSVGSIERIRNVAHRVAAAHAAGHAVCVVVSAMSGETNRLIALGHELAAVPDPRELDVLMATGELVSISLMAIALNELGVPARSFSGPQAGIRTDTSYTRARIQLIDPDALLNTLQENRVAVVAGFQGLDLQGNVTTLGRGGSDLTAVAVAAAIAADECEIYTDVDGVFTCDPNIVPNARKIERISFEEMLELASLGAKVLQTRSVELGMKWNVPIHVRSSFNDAQGTWVIQEAPEMEDVLVSGVAINRGESKITLRRVPDEPGVAARLFTRLADTSINVDMIVQNASADGTTDLSFTVARAELAQAERLLRQIHSTIRYESYDVDSSIAKLSVVGVGMRSHAGVAAKTFQTLADAGINIQMISTSEIKISVVIDEKFVELAARELHGAFGLDRPPVQRTAPRKRGRTAGKTKRRSRGGR